MTILRYIVPFLFLTFFSCTNANTNNSTNKDLKLVGKYNYQISVDVWNGFFERENKYVLNNLKINAGSDDFLEPLSKPLTLYLIKFESKHYADRTALIPNDTCEINFSREMSDTLFLLTTSFFDRFTPKNYDTAGKATSVVTDDSQAEVQMIFNGRTITAAAASINNPEIGSVQLDTLIKFVSKFKARFR